MGLSCRCCKRKCDACVCSPCPAIKSELLDPAVDYGVVATTPPDERADQPEGPLLGPSPPYPFEHRVEQTCGYPKARRTTDLLEGLCVDPDNPAPECTNQYDLYECQAHGPRMIRIGPHKDTTHFGVNLGPQKIPCSEVTPCPQNFDCVESDEDPGKSYCEYNQSEPCDDESDPCPEGYECLSGKCVHISEELTKEFLEHPIQAEFGIYPVKNETPKGTCPAYDPPLQCTDSLLCPDRFECIESTDPENVTIKLPSAVDSTCTDGYCAQVGFGYTCVPPHPAAWKPETFPYSVDANGDPITCSDNTDCEGLTGLVGSQCLNGDCMTPAYCQKRSKYCEPIQVIDPDYTYLKHSGVPTFLVPMDGLPYGPLPLLGGNTREIRNDPLRRRNLATDEHVGACYSLDLNRDPKEILGSSLLNYCSEDSQCVVNWGIGSRCLESDDIDPTARPIQNTLPAQPCDDLTPCPDDYQCVSGECQPVCTDKLCRLQHGEGYYCNSEGNCQQRKCWMPPGECTPGCCNEIFGDPWLPNHEWACDERGSRPPHTDTVCTPGDDDFCFEEHGAGYTCEASTDRITVEPTTPDQPCNDQNNPCPPNSSCDPSTGNCISDTQSFCQGPKRPNPDVGLGCFLSPLDGYTPKKVSVGGNRDEIIPRPIGETYGFPPTPCSPGQGCEDGYTCVTNALNAIRRQLPDGVACTDDLCEQRYGPGFSCNLTNFEIKTPKKFYKELEKRELPVSKTLATRTIQLSGSTGTWEVGKSIYQGDNWNEAVAKGIITGGIDLDTGTPLIKYKLQGDLIDFSVGSVATKEFDTALGSDGDASATNVTAVMRRCPYGYTINEFGFCQAVATEADGTPIQRDYIIINPLTDLVEETLTLRLVDSTGTWQVGDVIYQGNDWNSATAKGEITGGISLGTDTPTIEFELYGNQDFSENEQVTRHDATPTVKLSSSTGTWQIGDGIYQGADWDNASVRGVITGGTGLGTGLPIIEYNPSTGEGFIEDIQAKQYDLTAGADGAARGTVSYGLATGTTDFVITTGDLIADTDPCSYYSPIGIGRPFVMNEPRSEYLGFDHLYEENCAWGNCTTCERMLTVDQTDDLKGVCSNQICNTLDLPSNDSKTGKFTVDPGTWECLEENFIRKPLPDNVICTTRECVNRYGPDFDCDPDPDHRGCIHITGPIECINVFDLGGSQGRGLCTKEVGECELDCTTQTTDPTQDPNQPCDPDSNACPTHFECVGGTCIEVSTDPINPNEPCDAPDNSCPDGYDCENGVCVVGNKCPEGFECSESDTETTRLLVGEENCTDDLCTEQFGPGYTCNDQGFCAKSYRSCKPSLTTYFGVTSDYGGRNNPGSGLPIASGRHGIGLYNLDSRKIRTRLYLDYGYYTHYPFDKGHINVELKPTGCAEFEEDKKARIWKGNAHRHAYPKVNTVTIGNRFPAANDPRFDLNQNDDFVSVGVGPYAPPSPSGDNRLISSAEPGGLLGLGDPPQQNWDPSGDPPRHLNDEYNPTGDPRGLIKGCDPALRPPCSRNVCIEKEFEYLNHSSSSQVGLSDTNMDDWRQSNQSVFSHNNIPAGAVGGLIIDTLEIIPINYKFPAHFTSPSFWTYPGIWGVWDSPLSYEISLRTAQENSSAPNGNASWLSAGATAPDAPNECAVNAWPGVSNFMIKAVDTKLDVAIYYNSVIGRKAVRYDGPELAEAVRTNQFLPPPNGWLENIWQLGDIAQPRDWQRKKYIPDLHGVAVIWSRLPAYEKSDIDGEPCEEDSDCVDADLGLEGEVLCRGKEGEKSCYSTVKNTGTSCDEDQDCIDAGLATDEDESPCRATGPNGEKTCFKQLGQTGSGVGIPWEDDSIEQRSYEIRTQTRCGPIAGYPHGECPGGKGTINPDAEDQGWRCEGYVGPHYLGTCSKRRPDNSVSPVGPQNALWTYAFSYDAMDEKDYIEKYEDKIPYDRHWNRPQANRSDKVPDPTREVLEAAATITIKNPLHGHPYYPNEPEYKDVGISCGEPTPVVDNDGNTNIGEGCVPYDLGTGNTNSPCAWIVDPDDPRYDQFSDFRDQFGISSPTEVFCGAGPAGSTSGDDMCLAKNPECPDGYICAIEDPGCDQSKPVCVPENHIDYVQTCGDPPLPELDADDPNKSCFLFTKTPYEFPAIGSLCGDGYEPQAEADQQCVDDYGDGFTCVERIYELPGTQPIDAGGNPIPCADDDECGNGEFCNSEDGMCYQQRGSGGCKGPTITKDNCTNEICQEEFGPDYECDGDGKCQGRDRCPAGYVCHHFAYSSQDNDDPDYGVCRPANLDDTKLSKHLLDYWMKGVEFPSFSGDHAGNQQTWFKSTLDPYGEVSLKPWLNPHERDLKRKHKELNLSDRDEDGKLVSNPITSNVIYPPTIYSGGEAGAKGMDVHERATTQWWWEEPVHHQNPWAVHEGQYVLYDPPFVPPRTAGYMYGEYLAQLGIDTEWHQYDIDWMGQIRNAEASGQRGLEETDIAQYHQRHYFDHFDKERPEYRLCCVDKFGTIGPKFGFRCPLDADLMNNIPSLSTYYNYRPMTNVREVYRQIDYRTSLWWEWWERDPSGAEAEFARERRNDAEETYVPPYSLHSEIGRLRWWNWHWDDSIYFQAHLGLGSFPRPARSWIPSSNPYIPQTIEFHMGFLNHMGQPTGSYHGRDGMLRYNIHPWAQLYNQHRITDSLLEVGRSFAEKQKLMSSFGMECGGQGIFKTVSPMVFERFGYKQTGNVLFELEQPKSSQLAELIQPRFLNYRPNVAIPPGTARHIKIGGPGTAFSVYYLHNEIAWKSLGCSQQKYAIIPPGMKFDHTEHDGSVFYGPGYTRPSAALVTPQVKEAGAQAPWVAGGAGGLQNYPVYQCDEGWMSARHKKTGVFFGQDDPGTIFIPGVTDPGVGIGNGVMPERYLNPFVSPVLRPQQTISRPGSHENNQGDNYGISDGRSGTVEEEWFDNFQGEIKNGYGRPVSFYSPWRQDRTFGGYRTNWGTFELGKVYGLSKWPRGFNNHKERPFSPVAQNNLSECRHNRWFYFGGDGYFDPEDLRSEDVDLQNLDPDKGQFVFVQILGLQDELTLPGLPNRFKFGMVGSSHAPYFHHYRSWGMMPAGGNGMGSRFYPPGEPNIYGGQGGTFLYDESDIGSIGRRRCGVTTNSGGNPDFISEPDPPKPIIQQDGMGNPVTCSSDNDCDDCYACNDDGECELSDPCCEKVCPPDYKCRLGVCVSEACPAGYTCVPPLHGTLQGTCIRRFHSDSPHMICADPDPDRRRHLSCLRPSEWMGAHGQIFEWYHHLTKSQQMVLSWKGDPRFPGSGPDGNGMTHFKDHYFDKYDIPNAFTFPVQAWNPEVRWKSITTRYDSDDFGDTYYDHPTGCPEKKCHADHWEDYKAGKGRYKFPDPQLGEDCGTAPATEGEGGTMFSLLKSMSPIQVFDNPPYIRDPALPPRTFTDPITGLTREAHWGGSLDDGFIRNPAFQDGCQCAPCRELLPGETAGGLTYMDTHWGTAGDAEAQFKCLKKGQPYGYKIRSFAKMLMEEHVSKTEFLEQYYYAQTTRVVKEARNLVGEAEEEYDFVTTKKIQEVYPDIFNLTETSPGVPPQSYVADPITITSETDLGVLHGNTATTVSPTDPNNPCNNPGNSCPTGYTCDPNTGQCSADTEVEIAMTDEKDTTFIVVDSTREPGKQTEHPLQSIEDFFENQNPQPNINYDKETMSTVTPFCRSMRETGDWEPLQVQIFGANDKPYTRIFTIADGDIGEITENTTSNIITTEGRRASIKKWDQAKFYITGGNTGANETYTVTFDGKNAVDDGSNHIVSVGHQFATGDKVQYSNNSDGNDVAGLVSGNYYYVGLGTNGPANNSVHLYATRQDAIDDKDGANSGEGILSIGPGGEGDHQLVRDLGGCFIYELSFSFTTDQIAKSEVALILKRGDTTGFDSGGWLVEGPLPKWNSEVPKGPPHYRFARYQRFPGEECVDTYDKECSLGGSRPCGKAIDLNEAVTESAVKIGEHASRNNGVVGRGAYGGFMPNLHYITEDMWFHLAKWGIPIGNVTGSVLPGSEAVTDWGLYYLANQYSREGAKGKSGSTFNAYEAAKVTFKEQWFGDPMISEGGDISWAELYDRTILQLANVPGHNGILQIPLLPDLMDFGYSYHGAVLGEYQPRFKTGRAENQTRPCDGDYDSGSSNPCLFPGHTCGVQFANQDEIKNFGICYDVTESGEINKYEIQTLWISTGVEEMVNPEPLVEYTPYIDKNTGEEVQCEHYAAAPDYECASRIHRGQEAADGYCKQLAEVVTGEYDGFCGYDPDEPDNPDAAICWLPDTSQADDHCVTKTGDNSAKCIEGICHTAESLGECSDELCTSLYGEGFKCDSGLTTGTEDPANPDMDCDDDINPCPDGFDCKSGTCVGDVPYQQCIDSIPTRPNFAKEEYICARGLDHRTGFFSQDTNSCMRSSRFYGGEIGDPCPLEGNRFYRMDPKIEAYSIHEELQEASEEQDDRDRLGVTPFHWPWVLGDLCVDWGSGPPRRDSGNMGMGIDERFGWHHKATEDIKGKTLGIDTDATGPGDIDINFLNRIEGPDGQLTPGDLFNILMSSDQEIEYFESEKGVTRNTLQRVAKYYGETPKQPENELVNPDPVIEEPEIISRSINYNQYPNTFEAKLYASGIIPGYTNAGDMQFFSDFHRKRNDILQAQPSCDLWKGVYDFKWPMTPSTGTPPKDIAAGSLGQVELSTRALPLPEDASVEESCTTELCVEAFGVGWFCNEDGLCQKQSNININEKPVITFRNGATNPDQTPRAQRLWFHIDNDGCSDYVQEPYLDPPVVCDPDTDCGDNYECREYDERDSVDGCASLDLMQGQQFCLPFVCDPQILSPTQLEIKEKRKELGYDHLILQPSSNPELDGYAMCPTARLDVPYWGPDIRIRSAMMNRDLITKDECSTCSYKTKLNTPEVKIWPDVPCSTSNQPCIDKFGVGVDTACVTIDPETGEGLAEPLCQTTDSFGCLEDAPITRPCCPPGQRCLETDVYGCRECAATRLPTVTIISPEDQEPNGLLDPNSGPSGFAQDCTEWLTILDNSGDEDSDCGNDSECYGAVNPNVGKYSNFRAQYPYITTDDIRCGDPCQFQNICPPGFECNSDGDFCDPAPFSGFPRLSGAGEILAKGIAGSGPGLDSATSGKLVDYELVEVQITLTQVNSNIDDPNFGFPISGTERTDIAQPDIHGNVIVGWDTTQGPNSIYEIKATATDSADNVSFPVTIYVLVEN